MCVSVNVHITVEYKIECRILYCTKYTFFKKKKVFFWHVYLPQLFLASPIYLKFSWQKPYQWILTSLLQPAKSKKENYFKPERISINLHLV